MRVQRLAIVAVLVLLFPFGCKEGDTVSGSPALVAADFLPESPDVTARFVSLRQNSIDGGRILLDVVVTEVDEPITGIAMKLTYPDSFSKFTSCTDGDLLPPAPCFFAEPAPGSGEVFIGRSITSLDQATTVVGDHVIARIEFLVFGEGQGAIVIEGQNLGGGDASAVLDIDGNPILMKWFSGTLLGE